MTLSDELASGPAEAADRRPARAVPRVVVAVDAGASSAAALVWAADEALGRGMRLRIVTAFADPDSPQVPKTVEQAIRCQQLLRHELERRRPWFEEAEGIVRRGSLHSLISEATEPGDVLVIGGAGELSTMQAAAQASRCRVVIAPFVPAAPDT